MDERGSIVRDATISSLHEHRQSGVSDQAVDGISDDADKGDMRRPSWKCKVSFPVTNERGCLKESTNF